MSDRATALFRGYKKETDEAVRILLRDVPKAGGNVSRKYLAKLVRAAFRGGLVAFSNEIQRRKPEKN